MRLRIPGHARLPRPARGHRPNRRLGRLAAHRRPGQLGRTRLRDHHRPYQGPDHPRGREHLPAGIETALAAHPLVRQAVVLGIPAPEWGEQIAVVVRPANPGRPPTAAELHDHMRTALAPHKTPRHWYVAGDIPANAMGKTQKFVLLHRITDGDPAELI
ncbi:AMP-binding enzyme [Streptomyces acidicola]|uniref:AMP-binding enzyme n=1 Tax=Streptomyces acidicola TaxID=2596892 RepID=UPI0037FF8B48